MSDFKVDFIGIGAEKAATDWLACCLREHPEVCFSKHKELVFFCDRDQHLLSVPYRQYERGMAWYEKQFRHCANGCLRGEYTPTYLYSKGAARRIRGHFPDVKLIACLRDPVSRAFSQYLHDRSIGLIGDIPFEQALSQNGSYVEKGLYHKHLGYYLELFPAEQVHVLLVDDIRADRKAVARRLYDFLGLEDVEFIPPSLDRRPNSAAQARLPWLNRVMLHTDYVLRERGLENVLHFLEDTGLRRAAIKVGCHLNRRPISVYPRISDDTARQLRYAFATDIGELERLLGRDLSQWKP